MFFCSSALSFQEGWSRLTKNFGKFCPNFSNIPETPSIVQKVWDFFLSFWLFSFQKTDLIINLTCICIITWTACSPHGYWGPPNRRACLAQPGLKKIRSNNSTQSDSDRIEISFWFLHSFASMEPRPEPSDLLISAGHHKLRNQAEQSWAKDRTKPFANLCWTSPVSEPSWTKDGTKLFANLCWTSHVSEPSGTKLNQGRNQAIC